MAPPSLQLQDLDVSGHSTVRGALQLAYGGQSATVAVVGVERDHRFVPEPSAVVQLAVGGLVRLRLCVIAPHRRYRRA